MENIFLTRGYAGNILNGTFAGPELGSTQNEPDAMAVHHPEELEISKIREMSPLRKDINCQLSFLGFVREILKMFLFFHDACHWPHTDLKKNKLLDT